MTITHKKRNFLNLISIFVMAAMLISTVQNVYAAPKEYPLGDFALSAEEYQKHLKKPKKDKTGEDMVFLEAALPASYDARDEGIVTPAKNQGSCGSCWAFATTGAMESHLLKAGMSVLPPDLSEQQQVSCNTSNYGCDGGYSSAASYWENKGPLDEDEYPYAANDLFSETQCAKNGFDYRVTGWHTVPANTADFKQSLAEYGPGYWRYAVYSDFYTYWNYGSAGEVYVNTSNDYKGGHAVLLIGWDDDKNAFLCKNSWGSTGGPNDDGTFWIAYDGHAYDLGFGMSNFSVTSLTCSSDGECNDGNDCNGIETCVDSHCQSGDPVVCDDDGLYCNGSEYCDNGVCTSTGDPCGDGYVCDETNDTCTPENCGDGECGDIEDCYNCSMDCISGSGGGDCSNCFKGKCDGVCHPKKEDASCPDCAPSYCCGDGVCNGEEDSYNCEKDCGPPPEPEVCYDGIDNDGDGKIDCADSDCFGDPACPTDPEVCDDGIDNDHDGYIDCADSDCSTDPACQVEPEVCDDGIDNDGDDLIDCDDPDCDGDSACQSECGQRKDPCSNDDECCSRWCHRGTCK
jgi:papain like protease